MAVDIEVPIAFDFFTDVRAKPLIFTVSLSSH